MGILELLAPKKPKQQSQPKPLKMAKVKNNLVFLGPQALQNQVTTLERLSEYFKNLLGLYEDSSYLTSKKHISIAKYLTNYHPYGKKAAAIYKSFCINELEFDEQINQTQQDQFNEILASIKGDVKALQRYIWKKISLQGGVAFWLELDEENNLRLIDLPFNQISKRFDAKTQTWKYDCQRINLQGINGLLKADQKFEYVSDIPQFFIFLFDSDEEDENSSSFFAAGFEDGYTESLFRRMIREVINRLAILKHAHYQIKTPELADKGGFNLDAFGDDTEKPDAQVAAEQIKKEIAGPTGKVVKNPETDKNYAFFQAISITDENVDLKTFSTLETAAIKPIQECVEKPIASGLRVPSQFLGISESRTETQIEIELDMFLEQEREVREFIDSILIAIVKFKLLLEGRELTDDYPFWIKDSDVAGNLKRQKAAREKEEIRGIKLENLAKKQNLGFRVTDDEIKEAGFEAVQSNKNTATEPTGGNE